MISPILAVKKNTEEYRPQKWQHFHPKNKIDDSHGSSHLQPFPYDVYHFFHPFFTTFSMQKIDVSGHLGQLTSLGFDQCRRAGQQLKARYPEARIRAFSTVAWRRMVKLWG